MKNFILSFIIISLLAPFSFAKFSFAKNINQGRYKVLKVIDGDTIYLDFNRNSKIEKEEKVRLNGIDSFETKINNGLFWQMKLNNLSKKEALGLGYLGFNFAKHKLLGKEVFFEYSADEKYDKYERKLGSIYYDCKKDPSKRPFGIQTLDLISKDEYCKNYEKEALKMGLAKVYQKSNRKEELEKYFSKENYQKQLKKAQKLDLVFFDYINQKYFDIDCKNMEGYGQNNLLNKKFAKKSFCEMKK